MTSSSSRSAPSLSGGAEGIGRLQSFEQPLAGVAPASLQSSEFDAEGLGTFFVCESKEVFDLDDTAPLWLNCLELHQQIVNCDGQFQAVAVCREQIVDGERGEPYIRAAARMVYKMPAHGPRSDGEEMPPVLPVLVFRSNKAHVNLVHQFGGLQGMTLPLTPHQVTRQPAKIGHHTSEKFVLGFAAASAPFMQQTRDVRAFGRHSVANSRSAPPKAGRITALMTVIPCGWIVPQQPGRKIWRTSSGNTPP